MPLLLTTCGGDPGSEAHFICQSGDLFALGDRSNETIDRKTVAAPNTTSCWTSLRTADIARRPLPLCGGWVRPTKNRLPRLYPPVIHQTFHP